MEEPKNALWPQGLRPAIRKQLRGLIAKDTYLAEVRKPLALMGPAEFADYMWGRAQEKDDDASWAVATLIDDAIEDALDGIEEEK